MTTELLPGSVATCPQRNPKPRNQALFQAASDAAAADPNERRVVREFDACTLLFGMTVWYEGEFRLIKHIERPTSPELTVRSELTIHFVVPEGTRRFWFAKRSDPAYCLVDGVLSPC